MSEQYQKETIDVMFRGVADKLDMILTVATETKQQAIKTNGRVGRLENWRWFITGGLAIISMLVIPLIVYVYSQNTESRISNGIKNALQAYDVKVE